MYRYLLIILIFIFTTNAASAQSYDLKFSRVLSVDTTLICSGSGCAANSADYVVPANSIWKITYFSRSQGTGCYMPIWKINGTIMDAWPDANIGNPIIWLESGDTLRCEAGGNNCPYRMYFTGVEFKLE